MKRLLSLFLMCLPAFGIGSVQNSVQRLGSSTYWVVAFQWTGDASSGAVPISVAQLGGCCQGYVLTQVEFVPGSPSPTNGYAAAIKDSAGVDMLAGAAASLSSTTPQGFAAATSAPPLNGAFSLVITGQSVAAAQGVVYAFITAPTASNGLNFQRGGGTQVYPTAGVANSTGSTWGTSYAVGTAANDLVQLNGSAKLPAVDGSLLTNLPAGAIASVFGRTGTVTANSGDYTYGQVTGAAPLASPALTGNPTAPTQSTGDTSTKIATDQFVGASITALGAVTGSGTSGYLPLLTGSKTVGNSNEQDNGTTFSTSLPFSAAGQVTAGTAGAGNSGIGMSDPTGTYTSTITGSAFAAAVTTPLVSGRMTVGVGSANAAVCWKSSGALGYCSSVVSSGGTCTCN